MKMKRVLSNYEYQSDYSEFDELTELESDFELKREPRQSSRPLASLQIR